MNETQRKVEPPSDWFISLIEQGSGTTYFTLTQLLSQASDQEQAKALVSEGVILGRKSSNCGTQDGQFDSPILSRLHAQLNLTHNGHLYLTDLKSMHGTSITLDIVHDTISLEPNSPVQILNNDNIELGKRVYSNKKWFDPVEISIKFRYPEFGKGSTHDGRRKKIGKVESKFAKGKFANLKQESLLRRLIQNQLSYYDEKRVKALNSLEERTKLVNNNVEHSDVFHSMFNNTESLQSQPAWEEDDSVEFTHEVLSQNNNPPPNVTFAQGIFSYDPIDLRSARSESPISIKSDSDEHIDQENNPLLNQPNIKTNTYKAPTSILSISEEDPSFSRGSSDHSDGELDEDSMTDYDEDGDNDGPEVMGVKEDPLYVEFPFAESEDESLAAAPPVNPFVMATEDHSQQESDHNGTHSAPPSPLHNAWYSYSSEDEEESPNPKSKLHTILSPYWSPNSPILSHGGISYASSEGEEGEEDAEEEDEDEAEDEDGEEEEIQTDSELSESDLENEERAEEPSFSGVNFASPQSVVSPAASPADTQPHEHKKLEQTSIHSYFEAENPAHAYQSNETPALLCNHVPDSIGITKEVKSEMLVEQAKVTEAADELHQEGATVDVVSPVEEDEDSEEENEPGLSWTPEQIRQIENVRGSSVDHLGRIEEPQTPSVSDVSSEGPITPQSNNKRSLPDEVTIVDHGSSDSDSTYSTTIANPDAPINRPIKRLKRAVGTAVGYIAFGAALGTAGTIATLIQLAPRDSYH